MSPTAFVVHNPGFNVRLHPGLVLVGDVRHCRMHERRVQEHFARPEIPSTANKIPCRSSVHKTVFCASALKHSTRSAFFGKSRGLCRRTPQLSVRIEQLVIKAVASGLPPKPALRDPEGTDLLYDPLPFTFASLRAAIPDNCFKPSILRSMMYCIRDFAMAGGLLVAYNFLDNFLAASGFGWARPILFIAYSIMQGTVMWALFCIGHDCGHGSFSESKLLNDVIGHVSHAPLLVPYHSWRISHRRHHDKTGNMDQDESWYPTAESEFSAMTWLSKLFRFEMFLILWPFYLLGARGKNGDPADSTAGWTGSHFDPRTNLFKSSERPGVVLSTVSVAAMLGGLVWAGTVWGAGVVARSYVGAYAVFSVWLALVTYLHHNDVSVPWFRVVEWAKLRGALSTIDRDYGAFINEVHHNIGTHVVHHLFHHIPHYRLEEANAAIKPILGSYYRKSDRSIWSGLVHSHRNCRYVPDDGTAVYFVPQDETTSNAPVSSTSRSS